MINVTKTFLPPLKEYQHQIARIWENQWLTNNGELYQELTNKLKTYLSANYVIPMTNGTLPIQIALNAFGKMGEIITTPFSYVATTSTIIWEKCTPVFVDIHPDYLTINEDLIKAKITSKTTAILATHVYGNPCNVDVIEKIAKENGLKVIYDAAHCFGVTYNEQSIFNYGDVSTCSFHATKLFHTGEGGALFCQNEEDYNEMYYRHNFGHDGPLKYHGVGINAKMSELQAAMGLAVFPYLQHIIDSRKEVYEYYLKHLDSSKIDTLKIRKDTKWNYSYCPFIFSSESKLLEVQKKMNEHHIFPRRYFFPSLEKLPYLVSDSCPISENISKRVLCLPIYVGLGKDELKMIVKIINEIC